MIMEWVTLGFSMVAIGLSAYALVKLWRHDR